MIDTLAWPILAVSKKSTIGALLATIVLATTLVATPVPLVNDVSEASAHTQTRCFQETVSVPSTATPTRTCQRATRLARRPPASTKLTATSGRHSRSGLRQQ